MQNRSRLPTITSSPISPSWDKTKNGNLVYTVYHKGINYKIVLFKAQENRHIWMDAS